MGATFNQTGIGVLSLYKNIKKKHGVEEIMFHVSTEKEINDEQEQ